MHAISTKAIAFRRLAAFGLMTGALLSLSSVALAQRVLPQSRLKNGTAVRGAFRSVVANARRSTVAIYSGGKQIALGTVVDSEGYILTKASRMTGNLHVKVGDHMPEAHIVGLSKEDDLALLKVNVNSLMPVKWSKTGKLKLGQWVATVGVGTVPVSVGVVSVQPRRIKPLPPMLGVSIEDHAEGALVLNVSPGSGADKAGLKKGDIITWIAGAIVKNRVSLANEIRRYRPGDTLQLKIRRKNNVMNIKATLGSSLDPRSRRAIQNSMGGRLSKRAFGFPLALQHDSYLQPEECGGPIVDLKGHVVGINIARSGRTESYAIPSSRILKLLPEMKTGKLSIKESQATSAPPPSQPKDGEKE